MANDLLLKQTAEFDKKAFDQISWRLGSWELEKTRHIVLHLAKALGKVIGCDPSVLKQEVMPDLAIYRSQLLNTFGLLAESSLYTEEDYQKAEQEILAERKRDFSCFNGVIPRVKDDIGLGLGELAYVLEPAEHGKLPSEEECDQRVLRAVVHLGVGAVTLANHFDVDLAVAQRRRMDYQVQRHG